MKHVVRFLFVSSAILLVNIALLGAWHHEFPNIPLSLFAPVKTATPPTSIHVEPATLGSEPVAYAMLNDLINKVTIPPGWGKIATDRSPLVPALYTRCNATIVSPALTHSLVLRKSDAGILITASAYPAGLGPEAFKEISSTASACNGFWVTNDIKLGVASIAVDDNGALDGSGRNGRTIWVRWGDVLGMISIRGGGDLYQADAIMTDWVNQWSSVITNQICLDSHDTISDVVRSPLYTNYKGLTKIQHVTLTQAQQAQADAEGQTLVANAQASIHSTTTKGKTLNSTVDQNTSLPTAALPDATIVPLIKYDSSVNPILPPNEPTVVNPTAPVFPVLPVGKPVVGLFQDTTGPGCGWAFTGEVAPGGISPTQVDATLASLQAAQNQLINDEAQYQLAKWTYLVAYQKYLATVKLWNTWVAQANIAIVDALWLNYDTNVVNYASNQNLYNKANTAWQSCVNSQNVSPNPSISPSPSVSSATPSASPVPSSSNTCGDQPVAPVKPIRPSYPRP